MSTGTLESILAKYEKDLLSMARLSSAAISRKVISRTPRLTASLVSSWNASNGAPVINNVTISLGDPMPERNNVTEVINSLQLGDTYSFVNGKRYGPRIENEGWSAKAPAGMLKISVAEWDNIVFESISRVRSL